MKDSLKAEYDVLMETNRGPIWQFSGLALIVALGVWLNYEIGQDKRLESRYLAAPVVGDVYVYKVESGSYTTFRINSISGDSIFVAPNEYQIDMSTGIYKIDKEENYLNDVFGMSKDKAKEMYKDGEITNIKRKG